MTRQLHAVSVVGARPQFVKLAPVARAFDAIGSIRHTIVHTGQHYDDNMSLVFFNELEIPRPDVNLDVGSTSHGAQTGRMMEQLESWFKSSSPDVVVVYGDTNSTLAACLAATKLHIPVAHIEAGLRSHNRQMPEEINRIATDHCSDRLYAPTPVGMRNLEIENLASRSVFCGDVMRDAVSNFIQLAEAKIDTVANTDAVYAVLTLHRASNTEPEVLIPLLETLDNLARDLPIVFPVHPRTRQVIEQSELALSDSIRLLEPLPYLEMLLTVKNAGVVLTDSGGLQKEAAFLGTPCITLRDETEWVETVEIGANHVVGTNTSKISSALQAVADSGFCLNKEVTDALDDLFGDGRSAEKIAEDIVGFFASDDIVE